MIFLKSRLLLRFSVICIQFITQLFLFFNFPWFEVFDLMVPLSQEERKTSVLVSIALVFMLQVVLICLWHRDTDLLYALVFLPPKAVPPFLHAIFIITVNGMYRM